MFLKYIFKICLRVMSYIYICVCKFMFAVALNYQGKESPIFYNEAKFKINGNCGYLLKPEYMRQSSSFDLEATPTWFGIRQYNLIWHFFTIITPTAGSRNY
jgi:Phosphatidylinositol-specific phospholipase C, Y domain